MTETALSTVVGNLAQIAPHRAALTCGTDAISRAALEARTNRLARAYRELGVTPDSFVTIGLSARDRASLTRTWATSFSSLRRPRSRRFAMRHIGRMAAFLIVAVLVVPGSSSGQAPQFYARGARVFGCPGLQTLTTNGDGATQQGECTNQPNGSTLGAAVPIEAWVAAQVSGAAKVQNEKLQRQIDELTARVQALEAALRRSRPGAAPK
jgi:non-ribosomal peptide synthetase component E (peptide arylation enzyme)